MGDTLPTVWPASPHTLAKHAILERYLQAWLPILTRQSAQLQRQFGPHKSSREILFIDGFAGPGEYEHGERGSPVIALQTALNHTVRFPIPIRMLFIEQRADRFRNLQRVLSPFLAKARSSPNICGVEPREGDCDTVLREFLDQYERQDIRFGPALAFLDQFGYGAVSMDLISRILRYPQCEVFTYLDYKDMNRWITDSNKKSTFSRAFGGAEWEECIKLPERDRRSRLFALYKQALKDRGGAEHVTSFVMFDKDERPLYWLLFCTNNLRGLEEMKKAMWKVDNTGGFRFSDRDNPDQLSLLDVAFDQVWLADELASRLAGRTMSVAAIKEFVLTETPCYLFKAAMKSLELGKDKKVVVTQAPTERKPGTYPDEALKHIEIRFAETLF